MPAFPVEVAPGDSARAAQLASDASQAIGLGDYEGVQSLLQQAVELNPRSPDFAYRHARVLADLDRAQEALLEYCRAITNDVDDTFIATDSYARIESLHAEVRERLPEEAREAFVRGLAQADSARYSNAISAFTVALQAAPEWGAPVYNRGLVYETLGFVQESLDDYRTYLSLSPSDIDPVLVIVSERIGQLEGIASVGTPSPMGALAVGMVPGMGHYYTGRPVGGTVTLLAAGTSLAAGFLLREVTTLCLEDVPAGRACPDGQIVDELTSRPYVWYGLGLGAAITVIGAMDAWRKAKGRREEADAISGPRDPGARIGLPSISANGRQVDFNLLRVTFR